MVYTSGIAIPGNYPDNLTDPKLHALAIGYAPNEDDGEELIHEDVLPVVDLMGATEYTFQKYKPADAFTVVRTDVARTSRTPRVSFEHDIITSNTKDYGLEDAIPMREIDRAGLPMSAGAIASSHAVGQQLMRLVKLDREQRCANLVFNASNYLPAQVQTLSGSSQFSDPSSTPISVISAAMDAMLAKPNVMVLGQHGATALFTNPQIVASYQARTGVSLRAGGIVPMEYVASLFGIKKVVVGTAYVTTGNPNIAGQVNLSRMWGNHMALLRVMPVTLPYSRTFGFTAYSGSVGQQWFDKEVGLYGGNVIRMGESVEECLCEAAYGFFVQNITS
ncbi:MAG: hypothetical protein PUP93_31065 [Rhizonema sp. NSF051]|nr:hypothetical protein [Rhizonema sp. NSF051]